MTPFEFATAARIVFGPGKSREAAGIAREFGTRALVVTGSTPSRAASLERQLRDRGIDPATFPAPGEPSVELVATGARLARELRSDMVISLGGGSPIDCGKAIAVLATHETGVLDHLEVVGRGLPLHRAGLPFIAIPTTAGTGAEVTRNAVLASPQHRVKASLRSPLLLARVAIVDPELTRALPRDLTASTGMDALTQLIEPFVTPRANPMTDGLCAEGLRRAARSLRRAFERGDDPVAREDMAVASLFSGFALANAGLGAVHGFAAAIGGMFAAPHGVVCAALLPHVMEANIRALRDRAPDSDALRRYESVARVLTGRPQAAPGDGVAWVRDLCAALEIRPLRAWNLQRPDVPSIVERAIESSSMKANPVALTREELGEALNAAI
ncbi:MAG: iron-containing alcohol dehydrogenase [Verrucomicrobia bacterium]|nr:iron-containing alcohol dehydrogenase [Verrucomicrobiota bacterium]